MVKVSVIVAVYCVDKFICRCLESLRNQSLRDIEILLIDDGSPDLSGKICDEYAQKDVRFKAYHKQNEGVSSARQMGLDNAKGEYVIHVDPDDWVESTMLEELYNVAKLKNADLVVCDFYNEINNRSYYRKQQPSALTGKSFFYDLINSLHGSCCNKLVRRSLFNDFGITFSKDVIMWEDKFVNLQIAENIERIEYYPKAFYHYVVNDCGAVASFTKKRLFSVAQIICWLEQKKDPLINDSLNCLKKKAKIYAFKTKGLGNHEFKNFYSEINDTFLFRLKDFFRTDEFFIFFALHISLRLSRFFYFSKVYFSKAKRNLCFK